MPIHLYQNNLNIQLKRFMFLSIRRSIRVFFQKIFLRQASNSPFTEELELDQALEMLCHWGRPKLFRMPSGWHCFVDLGLNAQGTMVTVGSNTYHESPTLAALECLERARTLHPKGMKTADADPGD